VIGAAVTLAAKGTVALAEAAKAGATIDESTTELELEALSLAEAVA